MQMLCNVMQISTSDIHEPNYNNILVYDFSLDCLKLDHTAFLGSRLRLTYIIICRAGWLYYLTISLL